jgi:hypothetical protein
MDAFVPVMFALTSMPERELCLQNDVNGTNKFARTKHRQDGRKSHLAAIWLLSSSPEVRGQNQDAKRGKRPI